MGFNSGFKGLTLARVCEVTEYYDLKKNRRSKTLPNMNGSDNGEKLKGKCKISTEWLLNYEVQIPHIFIRRIGGW